MNNYINMNTKENVRPGCIILAEVELELESGSTSELGSTSNYQQIFVS